MNRENAQAELDDMCLVDPHLFGEIMREFFLQVAVNGCLYPVTAPARTLSELLNKGARLPVAKRHEHP